MKKIWWYVIGAAVLLYILGKGKASRYSTKDGNGNELIFSSPAEEDAYWAKKDKEIDDYLAQ